MLPCTENTMWNQKTKQKSFIIWCGERERDPSCFFLLFIYSPFFLLILSTPTHSPTPVHLLTPLLMHTFLFVFVVGFLCGKLATTSCLFFLYLFLLFFRPVRVCRLDSCMYVYACVCMYIYKFLKNHHEKERRGNIYVVGPPPFPFLSTYLPTL